MSKLRAIALDYIINGLSKDTQFLYREAAGRYLDTLILPNGQFPLDPSYDYEYLFYKLEKDLKKLESEMQKIKVSFIIHNISTGRRNTRSN